VTEVFITLEEAAQFEQITYDTLKKRCQRNPTAFKLRTQPRDGGGKDQVMVAVASLSPKARKAYKAAQKVDGRDVIIEQRVNEAPWYVSIDLNHYISSHKKQFYEAVDLVSRLQEFIDYDGPDRTAFGERFALSIGVSAPTMYRYVGNILEAQAWGMRMEKEDGQNRDYFRALSLCRKPKEKATFPSLTDEQRAIIENIAFRLARTECGNGIGCNQPQSLHNAANASARDLKSLFLKLFLDFATAIDISIGMKSSFNLGF